MAATNVLQWNSSGSGIQETDPQYLVDSMRINGATNPSIYYPQLANKAFYQWSTYICALGTMLANKGYGNSDANLAALVTVMNNLLTKADIGLGLFQQSGAGAITINLNEGNTFEIALTGNVTGITFTGTYTGPITLSFLQPASGGPYTVAFGSSVVGSGVVSTALSSRSIQMFALMGDSLYHPVSLMTWS